MGWSIGVRNRVLRTFLACGPVLVLLITGAVQADGTPPQPLPLPPSIATAQDIPYPGVIRLHVDATDIARHIFRIRESIPVTGGETITLLYPQWLPANHSPRGRVDQLAGLMIHADGERVEWTRDTVNVFAFHVDVPEGVDSIDIEFQFVSPTVGDQGRVVMTPEMLNLQWTSVALYPAGYFVRQIKVEPSIRLPEEWQFGSALRVAKATKRETQFEVVTFEDLIDSPIFAGRHFKRLDLDPGAETSVHLNVVADRADFLEITPEQLEIHRALVQEAYALYGSGHFEHYDFLLALTNRLGGIGLEHHQSSENSLAPTLFTDWESNVAGRDLLPHEFTHSWNGKFRRPADLWTPDYAVPMRGSLLWVYEGQTQYWGGILAARSGLYSQEQALDWLAMIAARFDHLPGRKWRAMQDTTNDPVASGRRPKAWGNWSRNEDYYSEGLLIWLDADTLIRELSNGEKSLDDFARRFFGVNDGSRVPVTYDFDDIVATLNEVQAHDWEVFLRERVEGRGPEAPLDWIERGGYELIYTDTPSDLQGSVELARKFNGLAYSLGIALSPDGSVSGVMWESPAYENGVAVGDQVVAVNGVTYNIERLKHAITEAKGTDVAIELLLKDGEHYRTVEINYHDGLRFPHLVRSKSENASLDMILGSKRDN